MLRSNLAQPENGDLRRRVLLGELSAHALCRMESFELAPEAVREKRREVERRCLEAVWDREGPLPAMPFDGLGSTRSSYLNAGAPPPPPIRRQAGGDDEEEGGGER
mmetsp:Transcript_105648/g.340516  ORF Transcript_105648/g.340516 Transcript_105648/m.340516 type:complete len:106 (-) Transcript_105648:70-387(-)